LSKAWIVSWLVVVSFRMALFPGEQPK